VRRLASALLLGMLMVGLVAAPALARANKVVLAPVEGVHGGGTVVFGASTEWNNLDITVQLSGTEPRVGFIVYLFLDCESETACLPRELGTVTSNAIGRANFHFETQLEPGAHFVGVDVMAVGPAGWGSAYHAPEFKGLFPWGIRMTFN
jgi:hypothetical protein